MSIDLLAQEAFRTLPDEKKLEVMDFIMFLSSKAYNKKKETNRSFPFDIFSGDLQYISDTFDDIPDGFEEYT